MDGMGVSRQVDYLPELGVADLGQFSQVVLSLLPTPSTCSGESSCMPSSRMPLNLVLFTRASTGPPSPMTSFEK